MSSVASRLADFLTRRSRLVLGLSLVALALFGARMGLTYSALKSDLEELLPKSAPSVAAIAELRQRLPGIRYLGVVIETDAPGRSEAAFEFLSKLATRVESYPPDLVRAVRLDTSRERRFAETYALQLMEPSDVKRLREAVEARRDYEVSKGMGTELDDEAGPPPELPFAELKKKYETRFGPPRASDRFMSPDGHSVALLVQRGSHATGYEADHLLLTRVQADVKALGGPPAGTRLGYAGDVATRVEETQGLASDLTISSAVVLLLVIGAVVWFYRSWSALLALGLPLALGTSAAFAVVALPPLSIRYLNTNTAFLGSIVIGNGINSGVMLLARIQEELRARLPRDAIRVAVTETWRPTLAAAVAAASAYGSLVFTDFRGFNQFGWIGGVGILTCWLAMYLVLPALAFKLGARLVPPAEPANAERKPSISGRVGSWVTGQRKLVLSVLALLTLLSAVGLWKRQSDWIEYDLSKLRRADSWQNGERYWGKRLDAAVGRYLTPAVVMVDDPKAVPEIEMRLRELMRSGGAGGLIADVRSAHQLLPETRLASIEEGKLLRAAVTPKLREKLGSEERAQLERALSEASLTPLQPQDLPDAFVTGLRERDGRIDRSVLVFPTVGGGTWQAERLAGFAHDVRAAVGAADRKAVVAGALLLSSDIAAAMTSDGPRVTALSLACVLLVCLGAFGVRTREAYALSAVSIASLIVGVGLMLGFLAWTGGKLNFSNFVALPITFGIGADYSINMLRRYQEQGRALGDELARTSGAVALCSATTVIGFGSLLMAENRALFSFGALAISGELSCLCTAVLGITALLSWLSRPGPGGSGAAETSAPTTP